MMADCAGFQAQIAAIIEILANSAVAEICRVVDEGYVKLRGQMEQQRLRSGEENQALRRKLRQMDEKMRCYERKLRRRSPREETATHGGDWRAAEELEDHRTAVTLDPATSEVQDSFYTSKQEPKLMPVVKQEKDEQDDCNLDLKVEVNITAECGLVTALEANDESNSSDMAPDSVTSSSVQPPSSPSEPVVDRACRRRTTHRATKALTSRSKVSDGGAASEVVHRELQTDCALKLETTAEEQPADDFLPSQASPSAASEEQPGGLGLDLAWMQERVGHLGAAYAVAQLGLGNPAPGRPPASFPAQTGGDGLDGPPGVLFPSGAHELAAFAASYDTPSAPPPAAAGGVAGQRPYRAAAAERAVCSVCGRVLASAAALELHQRVHTGERPFTCPHCGKGFAQPNNLRVHLLIHTGERRYRCTLCGKSFISSSHLKRHRTVHTQEKPYSCSRCGQSFSQMCSVRRHRQQSQCGL